VSLVTNGRHGGGTGISNHSALGVSRREELVRELKSSGKLHNILRPTGVGDEAEPAEEEEEGVCLDDFELMAVLGRGGFGKVMQVRHKTTEVVYAMKILKKSELKRRRQVERTQTERTILANVRHPFIVCLYYAFQNDHKLYMVMDFVQGGDFFTLMRKFKRLPEDWVRLYVAEIAMALQHLHDMDVVYRDLKPENILLCGDGHLKLTDFGLSRFFESRPPAPEDIIADDDVVTRSFCGTEQYMSPEMLLQQGHNWRMDWWCLGLLMHEMISARHPFHGPSHYDTLRNMVTKQPLIDQRLSPLAVTVVRSLLIKNPKARCCCTQGIKELKNLPFFAGFDWEGVEAMRVKAPYVPEISSAEDISSFEATFTREAAVDSITKDANTNKDGSKKEGR
jgi:ribosomal protein S6 kinase alpha-1/2/3/6